MAAFPHESDLQVKCPDCGEVGFSSDIDGRSANTPVRRIDHGKPGEPTRLNAVVTRKIELPCGCGFTIVR